MSEPRSNGATEPRSRRWDWLKILLRNRLAVFGGLLVLVLTLIALAAPLLTSHDPLLLNPLQRAKPPSSEHLMGTDGLGGDVWSRVVFGSRLSLSVGAAVTLVSGFVGILVGLLAGFYRRVDNVLMRVMDGLMAFPGILLAIAIMASLGPRVANVIIALGVVYTPRLARVVRGQVLVVREAPFVEAARAAGARDIVLLVRHILPNCLSPLIVQGTFIFANAVLAEAALSFLGVGAPPDVPSWGNVLSEARNLMRQAPWITIFPGVAIILTVLGLNVFGDGLRDALDPKMRD